MIKRKSIILLSIFIIFIILTICIFPERYVSVCLNGVLVWANFVLPSLFPFLFLTAILTKLNAVTSLSQKLSPLTKKVFNLSGISAYCFFTSVISGYPVGSKCVCDLYNNNLIQKEEVTRLSSLCSTSGPLFIIASVGVNMFNNKFIGFIIYLSHILSIIIVSVIWGLFGKNKKTSLCPMIPTKSADNILYESMYGAVISILCVGGFIAVFYTFSQILYDFKILTPLIFIFGGLFSLFSLDKNTSKFFSLGLIEMTTGCNALATLNGNFYIALACFLITFGGLSIIFQQSYYLKSAKVKMTKFILSKLIQALLSFGICFLLLLIFNR